MQICVLNWNETKTDVVDHQETSNFSCLFHKLIPQQCYSLRYSLSKRYYFRNSDHSIITCFIFSLIAIILLYILTLLLQDGKCKFNKTTVGATVTGFVDVESGNEDALQKASASIGPISVAIDASHFSFQFYSHGVYDEPRCSSEQLDHGVLAVGYGVSDDGDSYWLVKNRYNNT